MAQRILIVEDEPMVAEDIAGHLKGLGFEVAAICHSAEEAIDQLKSTKVNAAVIDISLGGTLTGLDLAAHINESVHIPFIFLTSHSDRQTIEDVKQCRAGGYVVKPFEEHDLHTSLALAISNHDHRGGAGAVILDLAWLNERIPNALSPREFEVLKAMRDGKSNSELADALFLSVNTVKTHLKHIYEKLGVKNRTEALFIIDSLR